MAAIDVLGASGAWSGGGVTLLPRASWWRWPGRTLSKTIPMTRLSGVSTSSRMVCGTLWT